MNARFLLLMLAVSATGISCSTPVQQREPSAAASHEEKAATPALLSPLVLIPDGLYRPLYPSKGQPTELPRHAFLLEDTPVTNLQFLVFVSANPSWQRDRIPSLFADENYLSHWSGNLTLPAGSENAPVTNVSWFAARAYAQWAGRRLPTLAEWESVGAASETATDGRSEEGYNQRILNWYGRPNPPIPPAVGQEAPNIYGVSDMHGLIWEWVEDFNSSLITGESRGDSAIERNLFCGGASLGAADPSDYAAFMRFAFRSSLQARFTVKNLGFRCAADAPETSVQP